MPNKLGLSTPEMPDSGPGSTGFPSSVRDDIRALGTVAEQRGSALPTDTSLLTLGDKFFVTGEKVTYEWHGSVDGWVALAQGTLDESGLAAHAAAAVIAHPAGSVDANHLAANAVTTAKIADNNVTDAKIGNRTINQALAALDTGLFAALLGGIASAIKNVKGTADWKTAAPITLTNTLVHVNAPAPHSGHETPTGAQAKVTAHNDTSGAHHGIYYGGGPPGALSAAPGSLYRDTSGGDLYSAYSSGWRRVGMIPSVQRGLIVMDATEYSHAAVIAAVNPALAEVRLLGVSSSEAADDLQNNPRFLAVRLEMTSGSQLTATRNYRSNNPPSSTIISWEVTAWL